MNGVPASYLRLLLEMFFSYEHYLTKYFTTETAFTFCAVSYLCYEGTGLYTK
jgi:hypothetical protein